jgi:chromosome segregation ATPase
VTLVDINKMNELDAQILYLQTEVEDKQRKIEELEKQLASAQQQMAIASSKGSNESEIVKNIRYDNQILMSKLSEYKKAEKNVKDLVNDYEQMKLKYFNVLTENSAQKTHIQELIQAKLDSEIALKELNDEKQQYVNEMYPLRMDITKRIDELAKKNAQVMHLQEEIANAHKKVTETVKKDKEIADL